jgi:hypothetical protein
VDISHNTTGSGGGVSLEEEIVEIDAQDDTDGNANGDSASENLVVNADVTLNEVNNVNYFNFRLSTYISYHFVIG